ncbi:hypothetical protein Wxf_00344 [Wolbachia endosymbiont of Armadillidium vulgare]|nr:hypothetical protein Wxf_00344 [Wolbachia endosymbiont of Armadillidium vulgare]
MVITIVSAVAQIELVSILLAKTEDKTLLTIKVENEHRSISTSLVSKLTKKMIFLWTQKTLVSI